MATYYKIENDKLNLASAFERWQMDNYGDCIKQQGGLAPMNDDQRRVEAKAEQERIIEHEEL